VRCDVTIAPLTCSHGLLRAFTKNAGKFLFTRSICLIVILLSFICSGQARAEVLIPENDRFDGSEFDASTFTENSFDKQEYGDLSPDAIRKASKSRLDADGRERHFTGSISTDRVRRGHEDFASDLSDERRAFEDKYGPVYEHPGNWVPGPLDLTSNGGFTLGPFNGEVVPYRLNGHVDVQRP